MASCTFPRSMLCTASLFYVGFVVRPCSAYSVYEKDDCDSKLDGGHAATPSKRLRGGDDVSQGDKSSQEARVHALEKLEKEGVYGDNVIPGKKDLTVVVAATSNSKPTYLADQPYEVHLSSDQLGPSGGKRYYGYEAGAYLHYILENYDSLPPKMAFLHCHRQAWEMNDESKILSNIDKDAFDFMGLSKFWAVDLREPDIAQVKDFLNETLPAGSSLLQKVPSGRFDYSFASGGAFLVSADRVRILSKDTWQNIYNWLQKHKDKQSARSMEFTWHMLLGEDAQMIPPDAAKLCPSNPSACAHKPYVDAAFPAWRLKWYDEHDPAKKAAPEAKSAAGADTQDMDMLGLDEFSAF